MPDIEFPIEELKSFYLGAAHSILDVNRQFAACNACHLFPLSAGRSIPEGKFLGRISLTTEVLIKVSETRKILFFFKRPGPEEIVLKMQVSMELLPEPMPTLSGEKTATTKIQHVMALPAFLLLDVSPDERINYTSLIRPTNQARPDASNSLLLQLPGGILAVYNSTSAAKLKASQAKLQYNPTQGEPWQISKDSGIFQLRPILELVELMKTWNRPGDGLHYQTFAFTPDDNDLGTTLQSLTEAFRSTQDTVMLKALESRLETMDAAQQETYLNNPLLGLHNRHMIKGFKGHLSLRLNDEGEFAYRNEDNPFQLILSVDIKAGQEKTQASYRMKVPDFLVASDDVLAFINILLSDARFRTEAAAQLLINESELPSLVKGGHNSHCIFRIKRQAYPAYRDDDDIVIFDFRELNKIMIVKAMFRIREQEKKLLGSDILYCRGHDSDNKLDDDLIEYTKKIVTALQRWTNLLN